MCGRYTLKEDGKQVAARLEATYAADQARIDERLVGERYNIAPTASVPLLVNRPGHGRRLQAARWGLVPPWAEDLKIGNRMTNARAETVHAKPAFRKSFRSKRALIPASAFYEWDRTTRPRQPYAFRPAEVDGPDGLLTFAGLYESWHDPERADDDPEQWVMTCTIITTAATAPMSWLHDRMPAAIPAELRDAWLDHDASVEDLQALLHDAPPRVAEGWRHDPVSTEVNKATNQGEHLVDPIPLDQLAAPA